MYTNEFEYIKVSTLEEAIELKKNDETYLLAGGHSLIPAMKLRLSTPKKLIDISGLDELKTVSKSDRYIHVGAMSTHKLCSESTLIKKYCPSLSNAASVIGDPHVRNYGTVGGSIAHSDPQADYSGVVLSLNCEIIVKGDKGFRNIPIEDYFTGLWETALHEDEILLEIKIPISEMNSNSCYLKFSQPASRYPYVGCGVSIKIVNNKFDDIRVGFSGVGEIAFRDHEIENALKGKDVTKENILKGTSKATNNKEVLYDSNSSEEYKREMAKVFAQRAILKCCKS